MQEIRIGMIGLDTSHCNAFAGLLNNSRHKYHIKGGKITHAFAGGSQMFSKSYTRVDDFTKKILSLNLKD